MSKPRCIASKQAKKTKKKPLTTRICTYVCIDAKIAVSAQRSLPPSKALQIITEPAHIIPILLIKIPPSPASAPYKKTPPGTHPAHLAAPLPLTRLPFSGAPIRMRVSRSTSRHCGLGCCPSMQAVCCSFLHIPLSGADSLMLARWR